MTTARTTDGRYEGEGALPGGQEVALQVIQRDAYDTIANPVQRPAGPDGASLTADDSTMVLLNMTAVYPDGPGFLTVYPCGAALPTASNVNYRAGDVVANSVLAPVGADGEVCVYSHATTHLVVDVVGHVPSPASGAGGVVPVVPARLLETRNGPGNTTADGLFLGQGRLAGGGEVRLQVIDRAAYVSSDGSAARPVGPDGVALTADDSVMVALNVMSSHLMRRVSSRCIPAGQIDRLRRTSTTGQAMWSPTQCCRRWATTAPCAYSRMPRPTWSSTSLGMCPHPHHLPCRESCPLLRRACWRRGLAMSRSTASSKPVRAWRRKAWWSYR